METEKSGFGELLDAYIFNAEQKNPPSVPEPPKTEKHLYPTCLEVSSRFIYVN